MEKENRLGWDHATSIVSTAECMETRFREHHNKISLNWWFGFYKENDDGIELHVFCDASTIAYGAVAYLKCISIDKCKPVCSFVMSKSRLAPMKVATLTVPRLELQAAVFKLAILDQLEFLVSTVRLWSDSQIIIKYIHNTKKMSSFCNEQTVWNPT